MEKVKHLGFASYLETGTFTDEFLKDFDYWCKRIYNGWKFLTDYDDFRMICWEALLKKLPEFDPSISKIQTFCISRISNEAWRLYTFNQARKKKGDNEDVNNPVLENTLTTEEEIVDDWVVSFEKYCEKKGVSVSGNEIENAILQYKLEGKKSPLVIAFSYWKLLEEGKMKFNKDVSESVVSLAIRNKMDLDVAASAYLVAGDSLPCLLQVLEGQTVEVPSDRKLDALRVHNIQFIEDDEGKYRNLKIREVFEYKDRVWKVVATEKKLLNHWYLSVQEVTE